MKTFPTDEFIQICRKLEGHHAVFYQLFEMGAPVFDSKIPTACVEFDEGRNVGFRVNPKFYSKLNEEQRAFVIAHETLHVLLSHGLRMVNTKNPQACNIAMDVVVNETLVKNFGFIRKEIDPKNEFIWRDKIFPKGNVNPDDTFEYYYNHLAKQKKLGSCGSLVDNHDGLKGQALPDDVAEAIARKLSSQEKQKLKDSLEKHGLTEGDEVGEDRGDVGGTLSKLMPDKKPTINRKWESVIQKWMQKGRGDENNEQWIRTHRRLMNIEEDIILPSEMEDENFDQNKVNIFLFLDSSGSCENLVPRFWDAYKSIPKDRFNIRCFCFDTHVYDVDPSIRKLYGFGGTSFQPLEGKIQKLISETKIKYPDAVFVFTDGAGTRVTPEKPERWHWFLSRKYFDYIPKESKHYQLSQFE